MLKCVFNAGMPIIHLQNLLNDNMSVGDAEVKLFPNVWRLFSGYFWRILANPGYFLANPG